MQHKGEDRQAKRNRRIVLLLIVAILAVIALAFGVIRVANTAEDEPIVEGKESTNTQINELGEDDSAKIDTPYCELSYPVAFTDLVTPLVDVEGSVCKVTFSANIDEKQIPIYAIVFGGAEGDLLGTIGSSTGEKIEVRLIVEDQANESLSQDDMNSYYAAKDTLNDVVASIMEQQSFVKA